LVGWLVGWLDGWMVGWLDGWMVGWLDGWFICRPTFKLTPPVMPNLHPIVSSNQKK
jgi:organic anion transporter 5A